MNCQTFFHNPRTRGKSQHHQMIKMIIIVIPQAWTSVIIIVIPQAWTSVIIIVIPQAWTSVIIIVIPQACTSVSCLQQQQ